jgi:hypothetical protein
MKASLNNNIYSIYNDENLILGEIKILSKGKFSECDLLTDGKLYKLIQKGWNICIFENDKTLYNLEISSWSGNIKILELDKVIKGFWGTNWATQLADDNKNTLLKIRNLNKISDKGEFEFELCATDISNLEILITLFGHLYGSKMKTFSALISAVIISATIISVII